MTLRLPTVAGPGLVDELARRVTYLRISVTDRCNYRCTYCMPEAGVDLLPKDDVLTFEELERTVAIFTRLGVRRIRLTGGEPTVRKDLTECVARLATLVQVVMTTNGHRLADLAESLARAGLSEVNVSLDTLDRDKFRAVTRRGELARVIDGIDRARALGIPVKMNVVALRGVNDDEVGALCDFAWDRGVVPRFIEQMPMSEGSLFATRAFLSAAEIRARIEAHVGGRLSADGPVGIAHGPARYYVTGAGQRVGIISALSENFCASCNRVRLTSVGELHTCLAHDDATNLRALLRGGATDVEIEAAIRRAVAGKRHGHDFTETGCGGPRKHMVSIGG